MDSLIVKFSQISTQVQDPNFWQQSGSELVLKQKTALENKINPYNKARQDIDDILELLLLKDGDIFDQLEESISLIEKEIKPLELAAMFKNPEDKMGAFIEINAGTGGLDSQDLAKDIERMYLRYCQQAGFKAEIVERLTEDVGLKQVVIEVEGENAYGLLRRENGIHRFVRMSPFNSAGKRQTSFVSVMVSPLVDDKISVSINPADLKTDTYRSSGAGGQHVNKTESAIRITHLPTGIVVACQEGRSQHQNKDKAMKILASKLYKREQDLKKQAENAIVKDDISWGNQIRNYVFAPYKLVKDLRSNYETSQIDKIMDGQLDDILLSLVRMG